MSDDDEVMSFSISEHDLDNAFNVNLGRPRISKNRATYGIWAEDSDEDDTNTRPAFGGGSSGQRAGGGDYTAPLGFVSAGFKKTAKEEAEALKGDKSDDDNDSDERRGEGTKQRRKKKAKVQPQFYGGQIAGLRKSGQNQPVSLGRGFGDWEKHTKGIGAKLLLKMGYEAGKGLGKELQGRSDIVEAHLRKGRGAIGAYGKEGNRPKKFQQKDSEEEEEEEFQEKLHQWKKGGSQTKKVKYVYKSADQVLEDGKWRQVSNDAGQTDKVKIIDMTGKEQRVLNSYHAIGAQKMRPEDALDYRDSNQQKVEEVIYDLPELRHNIDLLLDQCEEELISTDRSLKYHKNRIDTLQKQEETLAVLCQREKEEIETLQELLEQVEHMEEINAKGNLDLESAKTMFDKMRRNFAKDYEQLEMPYIAMTLVVPLLQKKLKNWSPLTNPHMHMDEFIQWKKLLEMPNALDKRQTNPMDPFHSLLWDSWMPSVRLAITSWNPKQPEELISFLQIWSHVIPSWMKANIQDQILLPKLQAAVEMWDPRSDLVPIHSWLHPWLPYLDTQLEIVYPTIRNKLASALKAWHPRDSSAKLILLPWKDIFDKASMYSFILKNILPKLEQSLALDLVINPIDQSLDPWNWIMEWMDFMPPAAMINCLERQFFPKWLQVLASWLNQNPNYNEVKNWYTGWKSVIPRDLLEAPQVQHQLQQALEMMTRVVNKTSGHLMAKQPGAYEAMMYLNTTEKKQDIHRLGASTPAVTVSEAVKLASTAALGSYKDLIARRCEERDIIFKPVPSRFQEGKQVYQCGTMLIYLDKSAIFVQSKDQLLRWIPTSLNSLLDSV